MSRAEARGHRTRPSTAAPGRGRPARRQRPPRLLWSLGIFRSELVTVFRRWRTLALFAVLAAVPLLVGIAVRIETRGGGSVGGGRGNGDAGPAFIQQISNNGLFLAFASLAATLPFFLPMAVGVVAGDAVAGEAGGGTLRYLLVAPAGPHPAAARQVRVRAGLLPGRDPGGRGWPRWSWASRSSRSAASPRCPAPRSRWPTGMLRALLIALLVAASLVGIGALGLFVSTLTDSGIGAMAATVGLLITVQIVDTIPQLHAVQPYLFPHYWLSFADVLRDPMQWDGIAKNLGLQALYAAVFGSAAWARFTSRDITA